MTTIFGTKHKKVTPETELFVGDEIFHEDKWLEICQITQDDGIQLSNFKWVCRTELQNASDGVEMNEWELHEDSGQQFIDALGGVFWLSEDIGDSYSLIKITVDYAGPNPSRPERFATELRAKNYVAFLIEQDGVKKKDPIITYDV